MSRVLKFRVWHNVRKCWMFGYDYPNLGGFSLFGETTMCGGLMELSVSELNDISCMQYTGLRDKNEKEIYEGDILKTGTDKPMVVGWSEKFASFVLNRKGWAFSHWFGESCNPEDCEIIGNIHQNPELMQ